MNARLVPIVVAAIALLPVALPRAADDPSALRLIPFPKEIHLSSGQFSLGQPLVLEVSAGSSELVARQIAAELARAGLQPPTAGPVHAGGHVTRLAHAAGQPWPPVSFRTGATPEDYQLMIDGQSLIVTAPGEAGLFYGVQTVCQLIRANRRGDALPCLIIRDWPSLRWRCFQNDMTRGPSAKLETLVDQAALGAFLKMNLFTYYMEYQYAFAKHPAIGPADGSLRPEELRRLVASARPLAMEILGNQQSFGHFGRILQLDEFAALRENESVLSPVREGTYRLLDDLYSEVCPNVPFSFFNVCCDETWGLGSGPARELAARIGVGGVYVGHLRRIHDLLHDKYHKRMMMWGDIILTHPDHLREIPKDTIMLTWGYGNRPSFEDQILPFARSGYEFFVCPGTSDWNRILPDFDVATGNIRNFVRDGAKHGALGMLNTEWKDDGESLSAPNWHAYAWGAECAWNASTTEPGDFQRRIGAVLFGEKGDHFGQAIQLLAQTHQLSGTWGMQNKRFWENDFLFQRSPASVQATAGRLLALVRPAIEHLEACRCEATVHGDLLDAFLYGARRMELIAQRGLDALVAAKLYATAYDLRPEQAVPLLDKIYVLVRMNRDAHQQLGRQFERLWLKENKPYALDWTAKHYQGIVAWYDALLRRLDQVGGAARAGKPLPSPEDFGLAPAAGFVRRTRPHAILPTPLKPETAWAEPTASHRLGISVDAGSADRAELPVELDLPRLGDLASRPMRAFCSLGDAPPQEILAQLDPSGLPTKTRLTLLVPGPIPKRTTATIWAYLGLPQPPAALPGAASTRDAQRGMKWLENDKVRLLLGPEGAHLYRWEVKALGGRDVSMPGEKGWAGFADVGNGHRDTPHTLICTAHGPALVRYRCTDPTGLVKTISLFGGTSWVEVTLNDPVERYWDFDNPKNFAADGPTPGKYLFSDGTAGPVGRAADGVPAQVKVKNVFWSLKTNDQGLMLGILTPETAATHVVAPGAGAGGVGIENSAPASHFVTYAGLPDAPPKDMMQRLRAATGFRNPPVITVSQLQVRP